MVQKIIFLILLSATPIISLAQQKAVKFDTMGQIGCEEIKIRLEDLSSALEQNPNEKALIIYYGGKTYVQHQINKKTGNEEEIEALPRHHEAQARLLNWDRYLILTGIEKSRFKVIDGGYREKFTIEFWIVPDEAVWPALSPTLTEKDIKFRKGNPVDVIFYDWKC